ncbi:hypothetical protein [Chachezhania sediminis]|uniref:hypothetical protein n=1 Tax=Chachezhania sediminis TaxID=2599291 RepID=UPI00131CEF64|nr:hypothetical protein [Chachezhania sediminis]
MTDDDRRFAFPVSLLMEQRADGTRLVRGIRYRWNTGETQIKWWDDAQHDAATLEEEPLASSSRPSSGYRA